MPRDYQIEQGGTTGGFESGGVAPGKRARTESLPASNVTIAREADGTGEVEEGAEEAVDRAAGSSGAPLDAGVRGQFEGSLGKDLSGVRVHTGADSAEAAESVGARAYTVGNDIHFAEGEYSPDDPYGQHLLAHEVAHTVQQDGAPQRQHKMAVSEPGDAAEVEADSAADAMVAGTFFDITGSASGVSRDKTEKPKKVTAAEKKKYLDAKAYAEGIMTQAETLQDALLKYHEDEISEIGKIAAAAGLLVATYDEAYTKHEAVIKKANEAEEGRQKMLDFALGIAVGVATAGFGAAFVPAKAAFSIGRTFAEEFISQSVSAGASSVIDIKNTVSAVAKENKEAERWKMVAEMYREAADLVPTLHRVSKFAQGATKVVGDCNAAAGDISLSFFKDRAGLDAAIAALRGAGAEGVFAKLNAQIATGWRVLMHKRVALEGDARYTSVREMEKKIWMKWVETRPQDNWDRTDRSYDQLDNDTIEDYLTSIGVTGKSGELAYGSGSSTDNDDERIWVESAYEKNRVLEHQGMIGRIDYGYTGGKRLVSPDYRSIPCEYPETYSKTGWYQVSIPKDREGTDERTGEKRIKWVAGLWPAYDYNLEDAGIDKDWRLSSEK